ncbi:M48 family metallopeptidase [Stenotrophomonas sp. GZD-301]|uniref:M48 family metallopeptidase n=1 Tax=Stenotrophomonas sp. GZD-301 TaxID=3404814 RepID=UPI003BB6F22E
MKPVLLGLAIALLVSACATTTSPTGRRQMVGGVSQAELDQLGAQAFAQTKQKEKVSTDGRQNGYVQCVVDALVAQLPPQYRGVRWETAVFVDNEPNAFALPGGKVGVNSGILTVAKNQDQLAAVIGHEIGHVIARHHEERITRQMGAQTGLSVLGMLAGAAYGDAAASTVNQLGGMTAQTAFLLPGSRTQESEADVLGQRLMAEAGFDPAQAVNLWQNMMAASSGRSPQWMSTHPDPSNRIRELQRDAPALAGVYQQAQAAGRRPRCG